ncbi:MAG: leucine-rich repeat protein [Lachnospiraceae bacterium]|nr:leucine-rich repeat protein [Lachnospiraceae bacterium]
MKIGYGTKKCIYKALVLLGAICAVSLFSSSVMAADEEIDPPTVTLYDLIPVYYDVGGSSLSVADLRHPLVSGTTGGKNYVASADPDAGISWDPAAATLTLENYNGGPVYLADWVDDIKHDAMLSVKIKIIGDNVISDSNVWNLFLVKYLDVTFEGDGRLTFVKKAGDSDKRLMWVEGNLTIDGPEINITSTGETLEICTCNIETYKNGKKKTTYDIGGNFTLKSGTFFFERKISINAITNLIRASGDINLYGGDMLLTNKRIVAKKVIDATKGGLIVAAGDINVTETRVITYFDEDMRAIQLFGEHYAPLNTEKTSDIPVFSESVSVYELTSTDITDYESKFTLDPAFSEYDGKEIKPKVVIDELKEGVHYSYEYAGDLINAGEASVIVTGIGSFTGELELSYVISPRNVAELDIVLETEQYIYDGKAKTPGVTIAGLDKATDYEVSYENNIDAGSDAAVIVTGKGNYTGTVRKKFIIVDPTKASGSDNGNNASSSEGNGSSSKTSGADLDESDMSPEGGITVDGIPYGPAKGRIIKNKTYKFKITARAKGTEAGTVSIFGFANNSLKKTVKKVTVPEGVTIGGFKYRVISIGSAAFKGSKKIKNVVIGKNVESIGKNAFSGCKKLKTITIRSSRLKFVGKNAIKGINKRAAIKVPKKKLAAYKKLFKAKTGYKKPMHFKN